MATEASPLDNQIPQPLLQALRDSLKGDLHFPGDQTCADPLELVPAEDHKLRPILRSQVRGSIQDFQRRHQNESHCSGAPTGCVRRQQVSGPPSLCYEDLPC